MKIKNYMEEVVEHMMDAVLEKVIHCECEKCKMDIAAMALNELPPKYVVTEKGEVYLKVNEIMQQFEVDVTTAIIKAAVLVDKNPRHTD